MSAGRRVGRQRPAPAASDNSLAGALVARARRHRPAARCRPASSNSRPTNQQQVGTPDFFFKFFMFEKSSTLNPIASGIGYLKFGVSF